MKRSNRTPDLAKARLYPAVLTGAFFAFVTVFLFLLHLENYLQSNINFHMQTSKMFGIPEELRAKGITPYFTDDRNTGWDGQFYYFMANDVLAVKDTADHVDYPNYRYQRIGLSLYTAMVAFALGMDWVSPSLFFISYLVLIALAVVAGGHLLQSLGGHPALMFFWSFSSGVLITLFSALPDAAADAFFVLGLACLYRNRYVLAMVPLAFSVLSREVYILFPAFFVLSRFTLQLFASGLSKPGLKESLKSMIVWKGTYCLAFPVAVVLLWKIYLYLHLGKVSDEIVSLVIGKPLATWWTFLTERLSGNHWKGSFVSYQEATLLMVFFLVIVCQLSVSGWMTSVLFARSRPLSSHGKAKRNRKQISLQRSDNDYLVLGVSLTAAFCALLYTCFESLVLKDYTGYLKPLPLFFFVIPFLLTAMRSRIKAKFLVPIYGFLTLVSAVCFLHLFNARVFPSIISF